MDRLTDGVMETGETREDDARRTVTLTSAARAARLVARTLRRADGPVSSLPSVRRTLQRALGGQAEVTDDWAGDGVRFARALVRDAGRERAVFVKYLPALEFGRRPYRRFLNETRYLRDLAPLAGVPHAALLHAASDDATRKAHLVLEDLTPVTVGWADLSEPEQAERATDVARLVADFHAAWLRKADVARAAYGDWSAGHEAERARRALTVLPGDLAARLPPEVCAEAARLARPGVLDAQLSGVRLVGLCHGDLHFQQVLWTRAERRAVLLDYQHVRPAPLGLDLAHLLAVRLSWLERRALGPDLLVAYRERLAAAGREVSAADLGRELRVGLALNFAGLWRLYAREGSDLFRDLLLRVWYALDEDGPLTQP